MMPALATDRPIQVLGWTLLHFVWQGAAVAAMLATLELFLARSRPQVRYAAACTALALMLALPAITFMSLRASAPHAPAFTNTPTFAMTPTPVRPALRLSQAPVLVRDGVRSAAPFVKRAARMTPLRVAAVLPWLVTLWSVGVLVLTVRLVGGWWSIRRLRDERVTVALEEWRERTETLARRLGVSRPVRLCRSALVEVPTVLGWMRPAILLPASTLSGLSVGQIEAILAHELAHIRRHDYIVNLLQCVIETLLFYHPAVWWVSRRVRDERELCCDDMAVQAVGDRVGYARALCELERLRAATPQLAMAANGGSLLTRIARLLGAPSRNDRTVGGQAALIGAVGLLTLLGIAGLGAPARSAVRAVTVSAVRAGERATAAVMVPVRAVVASAAPVKAAVRATAAVACEVAADVSSGVGSGLSDDEDAVIVSNGTCPSKNASSASPRTFSVDEWERLAQNGVDARMVSAFAAAGYSGLSADELVRLAQNGVTPDYARDVHAAGLCRVTCDELVRLAQHGVNTDYLHGLHEAGLDAASVDELVRMSDHGVTPEFIAGLKGIDPNDLNVDELIRLADHGVDPDWYSAMSWVGSGEFTTDNAIRARDNGVTPDFANQLKIGAHRHFTLEELQKLQSHGVDAEYAIRMFRLLGRDLTVDGLVRLRDNGVDVDEATQIVLVRRGRVTVDDLVRFQSNGVTASYVQDLAAAGFTNFTTDDLIRLYTNGVSAEYASKARDAGYPNLSADDLIRLQSRGVSFDTDSQ